MSENGIILYHTPDGQTNLQLRAENGSVWLTQLEMAELFASTKQNVSLHINNILKEGELPAAATVKDSLTVQMEGSREVQRKTVLYNLQMILAVGYWRGNVDRMLEFNEKQILQDQGNLSHETMQQIAHERYETFDAARRLSEAQHADADELSELEQLEKQLKQKGGKS